MPLPEEIAQALARAEASAREDRWQDVRLALSPVQQHLGASPRGVYLMAEAAVKLHDPGPARTWASRALELYAAAGDAQGEARATNLLGVLHFETGDLDGAETCFARALALAEQAGDPRMRAWLSNNLGTIHNLQEQPGRAAERYREALEVYTGMGDARGQAETLHNLGITHRDLGDAEEAERCFAEAARMAQSIRSDRLVAMAMVDRADLALARGAVEDAERMARMALMRFDMRASLFGLAEVHRVLGVVARLRGDPGASRTHFDRALELCGLHEGPLLEAETRLERGVLLRELGEEDEARADLSAAAETFGQLRAKKQAERARALLAGVEAGG